MDIEISAGAKYVLEMLSLNGFEAYIVGGSVRDKLMGNEINDYDIASSALPNEVKSVFSDKHIIETGIKHGTVTLLLEGTPYEITTFRKESGYSDFRHPDKISFLKDISSDLSRRDFTINAIAYSPDKGIVDLYGGIQDIGNKCIRAVGDPYKRFSEDPLRILRAMRFSSVLGFQIEKNTADAVFSLAHTLNFISPERKYAEMKKLVCGKNAENVLAQYKDALSFVIPVVKTDINALPVDHAMRFAAICGERATAALKSLRADNDTIKKAALLISSSPIPKDDAPLRLYISELGAENSRYISSFRRSVFGEDLCCKTEKLLGSGECLFISDLNIDGNDLQKICSDKSLFGKLLEKLLYSVINKETQNEKPALLKKASELLLKK